jgi:hypothetical protein
MHGTMVRVQLFIPAINFEWACADGDEEELKLILSKL